MSPHSALPGIIYGKKPKSTEKEFLEMMNYQSGKADEEAKTFVGPYEEPWLNVVHNCEPASIPAFETLKTTDLFLTRVHHKVLDVGAGTCWLTAKLSCLRSVEQVYAVDLSEKFLTSTGVRVINTLKGKLEKITFVISDFNEIPLGSESVDCALLFASLHHSLAPIKTLQEVHRCLKKKGSILILENPPPTIRIRAERRRALSMSRDVSEICHTLEEWEYLINAAQIGKVHIHPLDILSSRGWKMGVRKILRRVNLEHILINPPTYLFIIDKE